MAATNKHEPHVFVSVDLMPFSPPFNPDGMQVVYTPPPTPADRSRVCGVCGGPREDRLHIAGEDRADSESPRWG